MEPGAPRLRVLVADDAADVARRVCEALTELPSVDVVGCAGDGAEALGLFRSLGPDAVVLDLEMPGLGGLEVLRAIREVDERCMVVLLTNHGEPSIRDQAIAGGANHFFTKASGLDGLIDVIRDLGARLSETS